MFSTAEAGTIAQTICAILDEALADPHFVGRGLFDHQVDLGATAIGACVMPIEPAFRARTPVIAAPRLGAANDRYLANDDAKP